MDFYRVPWANIHFVIYKNWRASPYKELRRREEKDYPDESLLRDYKKQSWSHLLGQRWY